MSATRKSASDRPPPFRSHAKAPAPSRRTMRPGNLFLDDRPPSSGERFDTLLTHRNLVVERIVSSADIVPGDYRQEQDEWVVLLRGSATLVVEGEEVRLTTGDYLFLPAHTPHSVTQTSEGALWLAIHLHPQAPGSNAP